MKKVKFKKFLVLFSLLICVFCMTACDSSNGTIDTSSTKLEQKEQQVAASQSYLVDWTQDMITYLDSNSSESIIEDAEAAQSLAMINNKLYIVDQAGVTVKTISFYNSWNSTRGELGSLKSINNINIEVSSDTGKLCTITVDTSYEKNSKCTFEFVINDDYTLENGAINPSYTTGQKMYKAAMNTVIGMGTVFIVLIFISFIISLFKYVNKLENRNKAKNETSNNAQGVDNAIAQIVSNEEEQVDEDVTDDLELVAVITAAIAASEDTPADGLVVRSIRKVNSRRK